MTGRVVLALIAVVCTVNAVVIWRATRNQQHRQVTAVAQQPKTLPELYQSAASLRAGARLYQRGEMRAVVLGFADHDPKTGAAADLVSLRFSDNTVPEYQPRSLILRDFDVR